MLGLGNGQHQYECSAVKSIWMVEFGRGTSQIVATCSARRWHCHWRNCHLTRVPTDNRTPVTSTIHPRAYQRWIPNWLCSFKCRCTFARVQSVGRWPHTCLALQLCNCALACTCFTAFKWTNTSLVTRAEHFITHYHFGMENFPTDIHIGHANDNKKHDYPWWKKRKFPDTCGKTTLRTYERKLLALISGDKFSDEFRFCLFASNCCVSVKLDSNKSSRAKASFMSAGSRT